jgi:hypothetical protein
MLRQIGCQLATVSWQQQSVGNDKNESRLTARSCVSQMRKQFSLSSYEWNVASLFMSKLVGFKRSQFFMTGVSLVNKTSK